MNYNRFGRPPTCAIFLAHTIAYGSHENPLTNLAVLRNGPATTTYTSNTKAAGPPNISTRFDVDRVRVGAFTLVRRDIDTVASPVMTVKSAVALPIETMRGCPCYRHREGQYERKEYEKSGITSA